MKLTPETIVDYAMSFSIPIYQRLFEWDSENIERLLLDLKHSFELSKNLQDKEDYYIGMLTSTNEGELIDGQQRFTVMMLIGCALQEYGRWRSFIAMGDTSRLKFSARPADDDYLKSLIFGDGKRTFPTYTNTKMESGIEKINTFFGQLNEADKSSFADYIYTHLCFFVADLPDKYTPTELNKYFERMNCSGKNLEQHEILKVKLLSKLSDVNGDISKYMQLWNILADVDTPLIRERKDDDLRSRKRHIFEMSFDNVLTGDVLNGMRTSDKNNEDSIINIEAHPTPPETRNRISERENRCSLRFSYTLLHTLYWMLVHNGRKVEESKETFFNPANMLDHFRKYLPFEGEVNTADIKTFLDYLLRARLILDLCFIRPTDYGYELDMCTSDDDKDKKELLMLQSMLYVSASNYTNYRWFNRLMDYIIPLKKFPTVKGLYNELEEKDRIDHPMPSKYEDLTFGKDIRYWFWRLDFYIWQHRAELFANNEEALAVADKYVFIRNRSLEHIAPQHPKRDSAFKWDETEADNRLRDSFGNLVMISQGLNSSLQNETFEVKRAHVNAYMHGSKTGSIESLKLLLVYSNPDMDIWTKEMIMEHGQLSFGYLRKSYGLTEERMDAEASPYEAER